jgi:ferric-dicitrate binding protein FerR (iron transport regulator)
VTEDRALEIIAALGADPARWPDDERAAALALTGQPVIAAALADARALDALLGDWATADVVAAPYDAARLTPRSAPVAPARRRGWMAAGALAAAVAAAVVLTPMASMAPEPAATQVAMNSPQMTVPSATVSSDGGSDADFAYVFTPTVDEDALI